MSTLPTNEPVPVRVVSHTGLIYWWPVWVVGYLLAFVTWLDSSRLATVPPGTTVKEVDAQTFELKVPQAAPALAEAAKKSSQGDDPFPVRITPRKGLGVVYFAVIFLVVVGSNVPLRGVASLLAVLVTVLLVVLFALLNWWDPILEFLGGLHIQLSLAGYLLSSTAFLALWLTTVFLYDPLRYATFTAGQLTLRREVGDRIEIYDAHLIQVEKRPRDLLRHWILGLGAGDLVITIPGQSLQIEMPNVMFIDSAMARITQLVATRPITGEGA